MMSISVIIPSYKPEEYLYKCLDSILSQTLDISEYEVIIVLNGCKEPYFSNISAFIKNSNRNIKLIHTDLANVSHARNVGLSVACGEYISFVDDDDWVSKNYLSELAKIAAPNILACSNVILVDDISCNQLPYFLTNAYRRCSAYKKYTLFNSRQFLSTVWGKLIPRKLVGDNRFDTSHALGEDSLFMFQLSSGIKMIKFTFPDTIYYTRCRNGSASRRKLAYPYRIKVAIRLTGKYISTYMTHPCKYDFFLFATRVAATLRKLFKRRYE